MNKYGAVKMRLDGYTFDSKREAFRYQELCLLARNGDIQGLEVHPVFDLTVSGTSICKYEADFVYFERGNRIVEDTKGYRTDVYKLKKKLMKAIYGIDILESK